MVSQRIRLTRINADRQELELRKAMGELIDTGTAMYLWGGLMQNIRDRLTGLPDTLAPLLTGCSSASEAEAITRKIIHRTLSELASPSLKTVVAAADRANKDKA